MAADLRTRLTIAEARARRLVEHLTSFTVVPEYAELEREASAITRDISVFNDENTIDRELILQLRNAIDSEQPPAADNLDRLYREAGVILPGTVGKRFDEVAAFHRAVVQNRRAHLASEIEAAETRIAERDRRREQLDGRRRQVMGILRAAPRRKPRGCGNASQPPSGSRARKWSSRSSEHDYLRRFRTICTNARRSSRRRS